MSPVGIIRSWWIYLYCYTDRYQEIIDTNPIRETYKGFSYWDDDHVTSASLSTYGGESIDELEGVGMLTPSTHLSKLLYRNCILKLK
jgi:hypothetical protein